MGKGKLLIMDSQVGGVLELSDIAGNIRLHQVWNDGASTLTFGIPQTGRQALLQWLDGDVYIRWCTDVLWIFAEDRRQP